MKIFCLHLVCTLIYRNIQLQPCCLIASKLHIDPEDLYLKHFSAEKPEITRHAAYIIEEKPIEKEKQPETPSDADLADGTVIKKPKTGWKRYIGLFLVLMATMTYSLATLIIKVLHEHHPFTVSFWR